MNEEGWYYYDYKELSRYLKLKELCFVLKSGKEVIGCIFSTNYGNQAWLGNIIVHKNYREKGYAQQMITQVIEELSKKGVKTFRLGSVPTAIGLYEKIGFNPESFISAQETALPLDIDIEKTGFENNIRIIKPNDIKKISKIDEQYFKTNRASLINQLYKDSIKETCLLLEDTGNIVGFLMVRRRFSSKKKGNFLDGPDYVYRLGPCNVLPKYGMEGFKALFQKSISFINSEVKELEGSAKMYVLFPINQADPSEKNKAQWNYMNRLGFKQEYFENVMVYTCEKEDASKTKPDTEGIFASATPGDKA